MNDSRSRGRRKSIYAAVILFVNISWLFSPSPVIKKMTPLNSGYCGTYFSINKHMGFTVNCDAGEYVDNARFPAQILRPEASRQSRPLWALIGSAWGYPLSWSLSVVHSSFDARVPFYLGYVLINFSLLFIAVILFDRILTRSGVDSLVILTLSFLLICNDVTKAFVWTAAQGMLSIFSPVFSIMVGYWIASHVPMKPRNLLLLGFMLGFLLLAYGNFLLLLPILVFANWYSSRTHDEVSRTKSLCVSLILAFVFLLPTMAWIGIIILKNGYFYSRETIDFRQLVWMLDALKIGIGEFVRRLAQFTPTYLETFRPADILLPTGVALLLFAVSLVGKKRVDLSIKGAMLARTSLFTFVVFLVFFWLLGYYKTRLTFSLIPSLLFYMALKLDETLKRWPYLRRLFKQVSPFLLAGWWAYHVLKYGPFS